MPPTWEKKHHKKKKYGPQSSTNKYTKQKQEEQKSKDVPHAVVTEEPIIKNGNNNGTVVKSSSGTEASLVVQQQKQDLEILRQHFAHHHDDMQKKKQKKDDEKTDHELSNGIRIQNMFRCLILEVPLVCVLLLWAATFVLCHIHDSYYVPLMERARRTDDQLLDEYTYYDRTCDAADITTNSLQDLFENNNNNALSIMMTHGAVFFEQPILSPKTVADLRSYIRQRNANLADDEEIPMSQGHNRLSFGIDATEHESVVRAIAQVANHDSLRRLLTQLVGDDPAVSEITAITAYQGCPDQVWHADVKPDGNAMKFSRTYTHSFTLFMPLQDTTAAMGATDICPGTQYCNNEELEELCQKHRVGLRQQDVWEAGRGMLFNQQFWHRGAKHTDSNASERIVFILSFVGRPADMSRQLSRGTYFHMKWNMWGHTWRDLYRADETMKKPFSILRALGLYKRASQAWGFDLITSAAMRMANNQNAMTPEELPELVHVVDRVVPRWLQGPIDTERDGAWQVYIDITLHKVHVFIQRSYLVLLGIYTIFVCFIAIATRMYLKNVNSYPSVFWSTVKRLCVVHALVGLLVFAQMEYIRQSEWGANVLSGRLLKRPFPSPREHHSLPSLQPDNTTNMLTFAAVPTGPTTLPGRFDVLIGTRFDASFLNAYNQWLDYHPGNKLFEQAIAQRALFYKHASNHLPDAFVHVLYRDIKHIIVHDHGGRFVLQDYRTGDWRVVVEDDEQERLIEQALLTRSRPVLGQVQQAMKRVVADARFGIYRQTSLAREQQALIRILESKLFTSDDSSKVPWKYWKESLDTYMIKWRLKKLATTKRSASDNIPRMSVRTILGNVNNNNKTTPSVGHYHAGHARWTTTTTFSADFFVGQKVLCYYQDDDAWFPGSIGRIHHHRHGTTYLIFFDDAGQEDHVVPERLQKMPQVVENHQVIVDVSDLRNARDHYVNGTIQRVMPNGDIEVYYNRQMIRVPVDRYVLNEQMLQQHEEEEEEEEWY